MAVKLADAVVALQADVEGLKADLDKSEKRVFEWSDAMGDFVGNVMGSVVVAVGQGIIKMAGDVGGALIGLSTEHAGVMADAQTQLGAYGEEAGRVADIARNAWANNFGESIEDVGDAAITVLQNMGDAASDLADDELQNVVEMAISIRDGFEIEVGESTRVVTQLMNTMGLTADEAFALVVAGQQQGLDRADDWIDTLNEYSDDFAGLGLTADEVLTLMNQGLEAGAFNTDKIADGLNEFSVRLRDPAIMQQVATIDQGLADLFGEFAAGEITERDALTGMLDRLRAIEDPIARDQAGVQLFGSMWEDLGEEAFLALDLTTDELLTTENALERLDEQYNTLPDAIEGMKRKALVALAPISDLLLGIAQKAMPFVEIAFENLAGFITGKVAPTIAILSQGISAFFLTIRGFVTEDQASGGAFGPLGSAAFVLARFILDEAVPAIQTFVGVVRDEIIPAVMPVVQAIIDELVPGFIQLGTWIRDLAVVVWPLLQEAWAWAVDNFNIVGPILAAVGVAILALTSPIGLIVVAVTAFATAWANDWGGIQGHVANVVEWITGTAVPFFVEAFDNIKAAVASVGEFWNTKLLPPIMAVWEFLNSSIFPLFRAFAGFIRAVFNVAATAAAGIWQNVLSPALAAVREEVEKRLKPVIDALSLFFDKVIGPIIKDFADNRLKGLKNSFKAVKDIIGEVTDFLGKLTDGLANVKLPGWMTPGSPSPWELSLARTNELIQTMANARLPQLESALRIDDPGALSLAGAGAGAGGGTNNFYGDVVLPNAGPFGTEADGRRGAANLVEGLRSGGE